MKLAAQFAVQRRRLERLGKSLGAPKPRGTMDGISFKRASRQFAIRDRLASALKPHIGTFDHAEMTLSEIGALGCKRLGIKSRKGYELHTLQGYFAAKRTAGTMDSASNPNSAVNLYLKGIHRPFKGSMVDKYIHGGT